MKGKIFHFSASHPIVDTEVFSMLGTRGIRISDLSTLEFPIAPGFIVINSFLKEMSESHPPDRRIFAEHVASIEKIMGHKLGDPNDPLMIKVVESPMLEMVNTLSTVHNVGLCDTTVEGFAKRVGEQFAYREYANLLGRIAKLEISREIEQERKSRARKYIQDLEQARHKESVIAAIRKHRSFFPEELYIDVHATLMYVVSLFYNFFKSSEHRQDSCLMVQSMVFGNYGDSGGFGRFFTRHPYTGDPQVFGEYFPDAFNENSGKSIAIKDMPSDMYDRIVKIGYDVENFFKEIRLVRFTIQEGNLWIVDHIPVNDQTAQSEIKTLIDLMKRNAVDSKYVIKHVHPGRLSELLHPVLDPQSVASYQFFEGGISGAVGAAIGQVYFNTDRLLAAYRQAIHEDKECNFILAMPSTFAEDVKAIEVGQGVITAEGGYASHAPVVARSLGKVAMVNPNIRFEDKCFQIGNVKVQEGDYITINVPYAGNPKLYVGRGTLMKPTIDGSGLLEILDVIQSHIGDFDVRANADQPSDASLALKFNAKGIGLCRTEHMFFKSERINTFRCMIIAGNQEARVSILKKLQKFQVDDFYHIFKTMKGLPVTIRLLDAPLHEFLPHKEDSMAQFIEFFRKQFPDVSPSEIRARCSMLDEFNPMLGHRGVRVAVTYPEIYRMQIEAIFEAVCKLRDEGINVLPEIMIPVVMSEHEVKAMRNGKRIEGKEIHGVADLEREFREKCNINEAIKYRLGTMIELPAAALQADLIARYADFFSFGTNDLTQTTHGLSRDDFNNFFTDYNEYDLLNGNPFKLLSTPVKEMIEIATNRGRWVRPGIKLGLCGEHGAEPVNVAFAMDVGLDYVSCSAYGIPIAKLAIAQHNIAKNA